MVAKTYVLPAIVPPKGAKNCDAPENCRSVNIAHADDTSGHTKMTIARIVILGEQKSVKIFPKQKPTAEETKSDVTRLAELLESHHIKASICERGYAIEAGPGELFRTLGVLVNNGMGINIAKQIGRPEGIGAVGLQHSVGVASRAKKSHQSEQRNQENGRSRRPQVPRDQDGEPDWNVLALEREQRSAAAVQQLPQDFGNRVEDQKAVDAHNGRFRRY